ncbi:MAG: metallophosphoesterase [Nanobdellota archaeon]
MEILPKMFIVDIGLYLKEHDALVITDLQLGYEGQMLSAGIFVPKFQLKDMKERLKKIIKLVKPSKIIINGDFKHEFGRISREEWKESLDMIDFLEKNSEELILIEGNHDNIFEPIARKRKLEIKKELLLGSIFLTHGDKEKPIPEEAKTIVIGHEHPALALRKMERVEKFKCFLKGRYNRYDLIVLPSFNPSTTGSDILSEKIMSPYIKDLDNFQVYAVEDKIYPFGKVKDLQ